MIKSRILLAGALLTVAGAVSAAITVTPAVVSDYDFRGISQSGKDPAFQLGLNYAHESGFYAGLWGSNVDFGPGDPNVEVDAFVGFAGGDPKASFGYDVGVVEYTYVSASEANYTEIYGGITKGWFGGKLWFSPDVPTLSGNKSAYYLEANGTFPMPHDFSFLAHVGHSDGDAWKVFNDGGYTDWSVGVSRNFGNFATSLKYIDGSDLPSSGDVFSTDSKVVLSISTTLPWATK
jgi:uncharacterized protein (TIGR02001 family)